VGVWFYEEAEARKVAVLLQQITAQFKAGTSIAIGSTVVCTVPASSCRPIQSTTFQKLASVKWMHFHPLRLSAETLKVSERSASVSDFIAYDKTNLELFIMANKVSEAPCKLCIVTGWANRADCVS